MKVRQALAFSTDRGAIVDQLFKPVQADIKQIDSFATPTDGAAYTSSFSKYTKDLNQVTTLMTGAGWAKNSSGLWEKGGTTAKIEIKTTTNNKRRELTLQILQSQWKEAGFDVTLTFEKSSVLFGQDGPQGNFQVALFAQVPSSNDPSTRRLQHLVHVEHPDCGQQQQRYELVPHQRPAARPVLRPGRLEPRRRGSHRQLPQGPGSPCGIGAGDPGGSVPGHHRVQRQDRWTGWPQRQLRALLQHERVVPAEVGIA